MKNKFRFVCLFALLLAQPRIAYADIFGADVGVLTQILANAIQQLSQLQQAVNTGKENLALIQEINRGLNETLKLADNLDLPLDSEGRKDFQSLRTSLEFVEKKFGKAPNWENADLLAELQSISAQALHTSQRLIQNAHKQKAKAEQIRRHSHIVSPGGAAKLTAESQSVLIDSVNQSIISQAETQKILSASLALEARKESQATSSNVTLASELTESFSRTKLNHSLPRF